MTSLKVNHSGQQASTKFASSDSDRLVIPQVDCIRIVPTASIEFVQADSNYSIIHMTDGSQLLTSKTLKSIFEPLGKQFVRTHRSFVVNLKYIAAYRPREQQIYMVSNKAVLVSRTNKVVLRDALM